MYRGQQFSCKYISLSLCIYVIRDSLARSLMSVSYSVFSVKYIVPKLVRHDCSSPVRALAGCIIYRLFYPNHVFNHFMILNHIQKCSDQLIIFYQNERKLFINLRHNEL